MTVTEAAARANQLLRENADPTNTLYETLNPKTVEAIEKLRLVATEATFRKRRTP